MKKLTLRRKRTAPESTRITNDTVAEHREKILAGGRRYKYPLQYAKHKLVINATIVALTALIVLVGLGWWQLYAMQNSSTFFYRITQTAPLPVASIDGANVKYSDYLLYYRPSENYLKKYDEIKIDSEDGRVQLEYMKRMSLDVAIADAYARTIAKHEGLSVSSDEVSAAIASLREADDSSLTLDAVNASAQRVLGTTEQDTRTQLRNSLLRGKAAVAVDTKARDIVDQVEAALKANDDDLRRAAEQVNKASKDSVEYGATGLLGRKTIFSGLRVSEIAKFAPGKVQDVMVTPTDDGYYFIQVLEKSDTEVSFAYIHVPLTEFYSQIAQLREEGKIKEYIKIDTDQPAENSEEEQ